MQVNLNIEARERQIEQERIEGRQKMDDDKDWENHLIEKEKKRRGIAVEFKNNHLKRVCSIRIIYWLNWIIESITLVITLIVKIG